ncbi:hypothetical protein [Paenibacillus sp. YIM B09110]|uniref:hypothetical protein n=1 Tax=Paenibacillus sp. YIM B09110 TaxID=3126102 RepID=UPI00301C067E
MTTQIDTTLSSDIHVITAEINTYKRIAGEAIFEIGRRLKAVRDAQTDSGKAEEKALALQREEAGGWIRWLLDHVDFTRGHADRFIKVFERLRPSVLSTRHTLDALYHISTLSPEERERPHTIPSSGAVKTVDEMTVRELREVKAALKAAESRAEKAEADYETIRDTLESVTEKPPQVEYVYVQTEDNDPLKVTSNVRINGNVQQLSEAVGDLIESYGYFAYYDRQVAELNEKSTEELKTVVDALEKFTRSVSRALSGSNIIIDH